MIYFHELLKDISFHDIPLDHQSNLYRLHFCLNIIRRHYMRPIYVNSGYRSKENHAKIYAEINAKRRSEGLQPLRIPWKSKHLIGAAADLADGAGLLKEFLLENLDLLERLDLYVEDFDDTHGWCHIQIYSPASLRRFFKPF